MSFCVELCGEYHRMYLLTQARCTCFASMICTPCMICPIGHELRQKSHDLQAQPALWMIEKITNPLSHSQSSWQTIPLSSAHFIRERVTSSFHSHKDIQEKMIRSIATHNSAFRIPNSALDIVPHFPVSVLSRGDRKGGKRKLSFALHFDLLDIFFYTIV